MARWTALSYVYDEVIPILDDGTGPIESACAVLEHIEATSAREARLIALHSSEFEDVVDEARGDHRNPLAAIGVIREPEPHQCAVAAWEESSEDVEPPECGPCDTYYERSRIVSERLQAWYERPAAPLPQKEPHE